MSSICVALQPAISGPNLTEGLCIFVSAAADIASSNGRSLIWNTCTTSDLSEAVGISRCAFKAAALHAMRFETCQLEGVQQCSTWTRTSITPCLERPGGGLCRGDLILLRALPDSSVQNQASENSRSRVADRCFSQGCLAGECHTLSYCKACC